MGNFKLNFTLNFVRGSIEPDDFVVTVATAHYQSTHQPSTSYPSLYYTPAPARQQSIPPTAQPPHPARSSTLMSHHNVLPHPATTTSFNSRHVIASPFDIPSLGCVTTTAQSSWPDLMSTSYDVNSSLSSSSAVSSTGSRATRPAASLPPQQPPAHQPPLVFPSNPEPFRGMPFEQLNILIEHTVTGSTV